MSNVPVGRLKFKHNNVSYSILTVWRGDKGGYSISRDKHTEQYPAIGLFEALKSWGTGEGFLDYWPAEQRGNAPAQGQRGAPPPRPQGRPQGGFGGGDIDDDIPF